jgi:tRNA uridine 5-carboxymethylaminomethyl modification enzyme
MQATLNTYPNLSIRPGSVHDVTFFTSNHDRNGELPLVSGIRLETGEVISCSQVVICTGTFLAGEIHIGMDAFLFLFLGPHNSKGTRAFPAGRLGDKESPGSGLSSTLDRIGFKLGRLKTGTPARLDTKTINFDGMEKQEGEANPWPFSFLTKNVTNKVSAILGSFLQDTYLYYSRTSKQFATRPIPLQPPIK